jgi:hypothetical protein
MRTAMTCVSPAEVFAVLGPVEDGVVAEVIATGATADDLLEARAWIANDEAFMNEGRQLAASRVGQLIDILMRLEQQDDEEGARTA